MKALVLLSGGLDSATVLAMLRGRTKLAVGFNYGQPHKIELDYARRISGIENVPFFWFDLYQIPLVDDVVFAARNAVLITVAASMALARGLDTVAIGCNFSDWERFPDCRPEFIKAMGDVTKTYGINLIAPLLRMSKAEVVQESRRLGVGETWSCYAPKNDKPCGECLACKVRAEAGA